MVRVVVDVGGHCADPRLHVQTHGARFEASDLYCFLLLARLDAIRLRT